MFKTIFITGINGFVGSNAAEYFLDKGYHVVGLVRDANIKTRKEILSRCSVVYGSILDKELVREVISKYEVDYVLHLASQAIVSICDNDPYSAYNTNIVGALNVLEAIRVLKNKPEKVIVFTSDKYYGFGNKVPYKEDYPPMLGDTYCTSKTCQDMIALSYAHTYNLPIITVRSGNIYGPHDMNFSRLIPKNTLKLLSGKNPVVYSHAAKFVRDFVYVGDVCTAYDTLLDRGVPGEAYNIGSGNRYAILEVVAMLQDKINPSISVEVVDTNFSEISEQYLDSSKLRSLGWEPRVSLVDGLDRTIAFYRTVA